jgi:hypothetical protein
MAGVSETSTTNSPMISDDDGAFILLDFTGDKLDPAPLVALIPLAPVRPKRKGEALGSAKGGSAPIAKTGYCGFTTAGNGLLPTGDAHLEFLLKSVEGRVVAIRKTMSEQSLKWRAVFFEGDSEGQSFSDLTPELVHKAGLLGLPLLPKGAEAITIVADVNDSEP